MARDNRDIRWREDNVVGIADSFGSNAVDFSVSYTKGGVNYFSGGMTATGYWLTVSAVKVEGGFTSFIIGQAIGRRFLLEAAPRYNAKKLEQLASALKPHTIALVANLIARNYDGMNAIVREALPSVTVTRTKKALGTLLREALEAKNLPVLIHTEADGRMTYEIEGQRYAPGEAAAHLGVEWKGGTIISANA